MNNEDYNPYQSPQILDDGGLSRTMGMAGAIFCSVLIVIPIGVAACNRGITPIGIFRAPVLAVWFTYCGYFVGRSWKNRTLVLVFKSFSCGTLISLYFLLQGKPNEEDVTFIGIIWVICFIFFLMLSVSLRAIGRRLNRRTR